MIIINTASVWFEEKKIYYCNIYKNIIYWVKGKDFHRYSGPAVFSKNRKIITYWYNEHRFDSKEQLNEYILKNKIFWPSKYMGNLWSNKEAALAQTESIR